MECRCIIKKYAGCKNLNHPKYPELKLGLIGADF